MMFFFYGTLTSRDKLRSILSRQRFRPIGKGTVKGTLFDLGTYPALVLQGTTPVPGVLVEVDDSAAEQLDEYEAVSEGLYERRRVAVEQATGGSHVAWTYVYQGSVGGMRPIARWDARDQVALETRGVEMVEKSIELTGISANSIEEAVRLAVARAAVTIDSLRKADVIDVSANLEDGEIVSWRVRTRITFAVQDRLHE